MWRYTDYLTIREDFIPVFSEDVDKSHKGNWKSFIPHNHMRDMLTKLMVALERTNIADKLSLWVTGAYGTGKTFASFVIKHLMEDPLTEVEEYLQKHEILSDLWPRFKALRRNSRHLVIYRSASGHITSSRRLMIEVQQAIKDQLKSHGYTNPFSVSIMGKLVERLSDAGGVLSWERAFGKYRGRFRTIASAGEVLERLRAGDIRLGEQVASVLEEEGIILSDSPADTKAWIKETIACNDLQGIIFIWDEFTEFFANGVPVTPLQELAHATADMPFYLFLVTHRALNQFTRIDDDTRKRLLERFHNCQLEMAPVTAYKLIANVIEARSERWDEWEVKRDSLWNAVDVAALQINMLGHRVDKDDLRKLTPIHPFTAYLLAIISSLYSSSQRTLFQFLKKEEPGSFPWFVSNYPNDKWFWLTPDCLWQYFFENERIEATETVSDIVSHYHTARSSLTEEELRVFRIMLLLTALRRQTQGVHELLKPSLSVIKRMFVGTEISSRVSDIADRLRERGIMLAVPSGNDFEYLVPTATIDHSKLAEYKQRADRLAFERMVEVGNSNGEFSTDLKEILSLQGAGKLRHPVRIVTAKDVKHRRDRIIQGVEKPYEVGVILVVAQEDEHLLDSEPIAVEISRAHPNYCILISQTSFGSKRWREWLDCRARSWYHQDMREGPTQKYYDVKGKSMVDDWVGALRIGRVRGFFRGKQEELAGCGAIGAYLEEVVASVYPDGPEKLSKIATLYTSAWGKAGAEIGLKVAQNIQRPYKDVVDELRNQGLWENSALTRLTDHPLTKMQKVTDDFFATHDYVSLKQLWETLQHPPYGLMPSPIGILLFGVLLRSYAQGYYHSDGVNSLPLNPNKLADLIHQVLKEVKLSEGHTIRRMSAEGEHFCRMVRDIFRLTAEQTAYPEEARKNMRSTIMTMGYPLWSLVYYVQKNRGSDVNQDMTRAVRALAGVLTYSREEIDDEQMKVAVDSVRAVQRDLSRILSKDAMMNGMKEFWRVCAPELIVLMGALRLDVSHVVGRLRALLQEDTYLWQEERVKERLPEVVSELDLLNALNGLCGVANQDLNDLRDYFRTNWFKSKLPLLCYKEGQTAEVAGLIDFLHVLIYRPGQGLKENRAEDIRQSSSQLAAVLREPTAIAGLLVQKLTGSRISEHEARELYTALPNLSSESEDGVKRAIVVALSQQARQRKIAEVQRTWQDITGFESPQRWSEEMKSPIQWVLEGQPHQTFFSRYTSLHQLTEKEMDEMLAYLKAHAADLAILREYRQVLERFVQVAAGDYADLVRRAGAIRLQDHLYRTLHGNVYQWPSRLSEIQRAVRHWVDEIYVAAVYPQVVKAIESVSPDGIKRLIKRLAAEDALVGARLLAALKQYTD